MSNKPVDVTIIGAGFAGISALHKFKNQGLNTNLFEAGNGIGGTWYFNKYPGARCDTQSMEYSFQFSEKLQQEWEWSEKYATQPEILRYLNHTVDLFNLRQHIKLNTRIKELYWDNINSVWKVKTSDNEIILSHYVVMATGCLSKPNYPEIEGMKSFSGEVYHTSKWPDESPDFKGKKVGIIGTGSSGIQCIPLIAKEASHLTVFQRTPNYTVPARNKPLDDNFVESIKSRYQEFRKDNYKLGFGLSLPLNDVSALDVSEEERHKQFEIQWQNGGLGFLTAFNDIIFNMDANKHAQDFIRNKINSIVDDKKTAKLLSPSTPVACKRLCVDTDYYQTYNLPNVNLIDIKETPIDSIKTNGLLIGEEIHQLDTLIIATGFDAMTGSIMNIDIRGKNGLSIKEKWVNGPSTYLGIATSGFPNLFMITGPGSPSVLSNMVPSIEQHVNWISECIDYLQKHKYQKIEVEIEAEEKWTDELLNISDGTIYPHCNSWYLGSNIEGKKQVFTAYLGVPPYIEHCENVVKDGYNGFVCSRD